MTAPQSTNATSVTQLDTDTATLGQVQNQLIALLTECAQRHQAIDAEYVPRVNALLEQAQAEFDRIHGLANAARPVIVTKGKSAKRQTGTHAWKNVVRADFGQVTDDEFIQAVLDADSPRLKRRFLRRVNRWEVNRNALTATANRAVVIDELVPALDGEFALTETEEYLCSPAGGFKMSTSHRVWPSYDGLPLTEAWENILRGPEV